MNICLCVSWYYPNSIGGTETYVHALANFLQNSGHNVSILKPGKENEPAYLYDGIEVHSFYPGSSFSKQMYLGLRSPDLSDFEHKLKSVQPDVVHFHSLTGPAGITLFHVEKARQIARKIFFTFHLPHLTCATSTFDRLKKEPCDGVAEPQKCAACLFAHRGWPSPAAKVLGGFSNLLNEKKVKLLGSNGLLTRLGSAEWITLRKEQLVGLTSLCDKLICLSSWFYDVLVRNNVNPEKIALIEQGLLLDETEFIPKPKQQLVSSDPVKLVYLGRLDPIKGVGLLLSVLKQFNEADVELDLYGPVDEAYSAGLQPYFAKKNIRYKGLLKRDEVLPALNLYDVIVVPSTVTEMAPLVLQEAFAAGIPAIASDVAGNAAFVKPTVNGWLFKSGSEESLKDLLSSVLKHKNELANISNNLSPVRTINTIGNEHLGLYLST